MSEIDQELEERRNAELEFISCAYTPDEAWSETDQACPQIHRRLILPNGNNADGVSVLLSLRMPLKYPLSEGLDISCVVEHKNEATSAVYKTVPKLVDACRSQVIVGEESVFLVLRRAEAWVEECWSSFNTYETERRSQAVTQLSSINKKLILGRRLIYSHHIISKVKRGDIHDLALHYKLTGYMKVGWPGIILIEGAEDDCIAFYDEIRPWSWKFLVVRGEQQESVLDVEENRKFMAFIETDDMSQVAQHCREVGLESLFRTALKVYDNNEFSDNDDGEVSNPPYGFLVLVNHMNDAKGYRKWLRKTAKEENCCIMIKQSFPMDDFSKRPFIVVAIVGPKESAQLFLKRWRTSRVDVDSKGKPCLERMMTILTDGNLHDSSPIDWDQAQADGSVNVTNARLTELVASIGGQSWKKLLSQFMV